MDYSVAVIHIRKADMRIDLTSNDHALNELDKKNWEACKLQHSKHQQLDHNIPV